MPSRGARAFCMGFIQGEDRGQATMFPATLDELTPGRSCVSRHQGVGENVLGGNVLLAALSV